MPPPRAFLSSLEQFGIKLGLEQIRALVARLDHPERSFPSIVVAGTNGKGSVTAMIERGLRAAGFRTGRYTSPHLVDLEERFAIDGLPISGQQLDLALAGVQAASSALERPPSYFEATTAAALDAFRRAAVDVAVLEVGLGGRLDATNVVDPAAVVITAIDFDHEAHLGHSLIAIAREKAGVIKPGVPLVVLADNPPEVERVIRDAATKARARLVRASEGVSLDARMLEGRLRVDLRTPVNDYGTLVLALRGRHQIGNVVTAVRLLEALAAGGRFEVPEGAVRTAVENTVWPARLELVVRDGGDLLIDGAHNPAGARALAAYVLEAFGRALPMVIGVMADKDAAAILTALAPAASHFTMTACRSSRALPAGDLLAVAGRVAPAIPATAEPNPREAVLRAAAIGQPVVIAGSLYLAGEVRGGFT